MPCQSLQEIVANLLNAGIPLRLELSPFNIPLTPAQPLPLPTPAPAPAQTVAVNNPPPLSTKQSEKPKLPQAADKKQNDRSEKKPVEKSSLAKMTAVPPVTSTQDKVIA
jgi:hypothetical protein